MVDAKAVDVKEAVGVSINVQFASPAGMGAKNMVIQTHYPQSGDFSGLAGLFEEVDYHAARYEIITLDKLIEDAEFDLVREQNGLSDFVNQDKIQHQNSGRKVDYKMNGQVASQVLKLEKIIRQYERRLDSLKDERAKKKAIVDKHENKPTAKKNAA